ncbi:MAG: hypothetical protein ABI275_01155 [Terrimesophilobacter sp.]
MPYAPVRQVGRRPREATAGKGFERMPTAINMLFDGKNVDKLVVKTSG